MSKQALPIALCIMATIFLACPTNTSIGSEEPETGPSFDVLSKGFRLPEKKYSPETWFHINGNNISKDGLTRDLEAIKEAGLQGIHLFNKSGKSYPGVAPIKILSPEWEDMIRHAADESKRLGLKFTMQNCPGWSMTGGPWVPVEEAQREIVETVYRVSGAKPFSDMLEIDSAFTTPEHDYKDVLLVAFPTPAGDDLEPFIPWKIESNNKMAPWKAIFDSRSKMIITHKTTYLDKELPDYRRQGLNKINGENTWVKTQFKNPVTLRSITFPPLRHIILNAQYPKMDVAIKVEALIDGKMVKVTTVEFPAANWNDRRKHFTLAIPETTSEQFVFTFEGDHPIAPEFIRLSAKPLLHNYQAKAAKVLRGLQKDIISNYQDSAILKSDAIIDLTDRMTSEGRLNWKVPKGNWTIIRFGHVNMRLTNKPAVPEATGWESSKLDKSAIENHLRDGMIGKMIEKGGPIGDGKLFGLLIDSWESNVPTWTINAEDMFIEFEKRRGYSMKPYLAATVGYIIDSQENTHRFLRDLRHTMDEVFIDNFFDHFATVAHEMGAKVYTEGAGGEVLPVDPMRYYGVSDIPMTEFWFPKAPSSQNEYAKPIYSAASAAHLYNKPVLAAEACTQLNVQWNEHPFDVKYLIDYNFTKGVNHLVFHTFSHTPQQQVFPGSSFGGNIGFPLVRQQTWWKYMPDWVDYLRRNQYVLQQGKYVAEVLWYYGDHFERPPFDLDEFPKGYRFDYLNAEILQNKLSVRNGKIHVQDAGNYRVIRLRDSKQMLLSTAQKLKDLVNQGAVILGDKPIGSPSLMDDEQDIKELLEIADQLWGTSERGVKKVGKGKVYWGKPLQEVLELERIAPDVVVPNGTEINWIHRKTKDADLYFIASKMDKPLSVALSFNISNAQPYFWNAHNGDQQQAKVWSTDGNRTNVAISLPKNGSTILVFTKGNNKPIASKITRDQKVILSTQTGWYRIGEEEIQTPIAWEKDQPIFALSGEYQLIDGDQSETQKNEVETLSLQSDWKLNFERGWDAPEAIYLPKLAPLNEHENKSVKHYSGTVTYSKKFVLDAQNKNTLLDLGKVANIAEVWCNDKKIGTKWAPPFVFDLSDFVAVGQNKLHIKVTNTWRNQLIFDNTRPTHLKKTWTTNPPKNHENTLEEAGLIGPVILRKIK